MANVKLTDVRKTFGSVEVIKGVNLEITDREFVVFVGPSGCGKSTLLRMIAGLEDISSGTVAIDGTVVNDLPPSRRHIAMVFQSYALYPHKNVRDNMAFGLRMAKMDKGTIDRKVLEAARVLELEPLLERRPKELSGGQRQRVAIGRAIVRNPRLFLFDEPLSNLDAALRGQMRVEIARLHQALDATMIYVTHDQVEAMTLADKIVILNSGKIEQVGTPLELYHTPDNLFVAGFIGSPKMNFLKATVAERGLDSTSVRLGNGSLIEFPTGPSKLSVGASVTVGIRPEHLEQGKSDSSISATAYVVERLGSETHVYAKLDTGETLVAVFDGYSWVEVGELLDIQIPGAKGYLFDAGGASVPLASHILDPSLVRASARSRAGRSGQATIQMPIRH
jgi:multiple sugar transport system ATP-binding protein